MYLYNNAICIKLHYNAIEAPPSYPKLQKSVSIVTNWTVMSVYCDGPDDHPSYMEAYS